MCLSNPSQCENEILIYWEVYTIENPLVDWYKYEKWFGHNNAYNFVNEFGKFCENHWKQIDDSVKN